MNIRPKRAAALAFGSIIAAAPIWPYSHGFNWWPALLLCNVYGVVALALLVRDATSYGASNKEH